METSQLFKLAGHALKYHRDALSGIGLSPDGRRSSTTCGLCRYDQRSPKCWSQRQDLCLSCHMRGERPKWLRTSGFAVSRWRKSMGASQQDFADACGWSRVRQTRLESQRKVNCGTATELAHAIVKLAAADHSIELVIREWPLFILLVPAEVMAEACKEVNL